ncbi:hypothetical protein TRFO_05622 [Tritrichomonas foetus]|uniref:Uncharacterized protein n=1 Tax=Tritrichomonas foetus TaxID=1144522 RepID=A0A1J4K5D6_9EUKA|nr:hypothetical protein TRFO_05622 [Tritrichomonas foetus]|eukprot:OHT06411.1 hypothetical protein TRFO_05622 [Tritrichomonas foetus]
MRKKRETHEDEDDSYLLQRLMKAKNISETGMDQIKLIACFQDKIKELLHCRDIADTLKTQLCVEKESNRKLKEENEFLKSESEARFLSYSSEASAFSGRYQSSSSTFSNHKKTNIPKDYSELKEKNQNLKDQIKELKQKIQILKTENDKMTHDDEKKKQEENNLQIDYNKILQEYETMKQEKENLKEMNENKHKDNEKILQENEKLKKENESLYAENANLYQENEKLKQQVEDKSIDFQKQSNDLQKQSNDYEKQIIHLQNKIDRRNKMIETFKITENERLENIGLLEKKFIEKNKKVAIYQQIVDRQIHFGQQQQLRCVFCRILAERFKEIDNAISNLHGSLTGHKESGLQSIILAITFCLRWRNEKFRKNMNIEPESLLYYASNKRLPLLAKLCDIQSIFSQLTNSLSNTKEELNKSLLQNMSSKRDYFEMENIIEQSQTGCKNLQTQVKVYKTMIENMNEEMALLIKPEKFQDLLMKNSNLQLKIDSLIEKCHQLELEIVEKNKEVMKAKSLQRIAEEQHELDVENIKVEQQEVQKHKDSVEILTTKLMGRSKDLLSYERMIYAVQPKVLSRSSHSNAIDELPPDFTKADINPKFL